MQLELLRKQRGRRFTGRRADHRPGPGGVCEPLHDLGGLVVAFRQRNHELPEQEGAEGGEGHGQDESDVGVHQAELHHDLVVGQREHETGDHHRAEVEQKHGVAPSPLEPGEGEGGHGTGHDLQAGDPQVIAGANMALTALQLNAALQSLLFTALIGLPKYPGSGTFVRVGLTGVFVHNGLTGEFERQSLTGSFERRV